MREGRRQLAYLGIGAVVVLATMLLRRPPAAPALPPAPPKAGTHLADLERALQAERDGLDGASRAALQALVATLGATGAAGHDALQAAGEAVAALPGAGAVLLAVVTDAQQPPLRRADACRLLGLLRERRAVPALGAIVTDPRDDADPHVQASAAEALGAIGERAAIVPLAYALRDNRPMRHQVMRAKAIAALQLGCRYGGNACVDILMDWNSDMAKRPRVFDRELAARALLAAAVRAGTPVAADPSPFRLPGALRTELDRIAAWWRDARQAPPEPHVSTDPQLLAAMLQPHLDRFSGESFFYRKLAQEILIGLGADGRPYLLHALRDARVSWRQYAAEALGETRDAGAIAHLAHLFRNEASPLVRREAVRAMRRIEKDVAAPTAAQRAELDAAIARARQDPDPGVRQAAGR